jgi:glutamyl/glutaminyl-tRNA synthetase
MSAPTAPLLRTPEPRTTGVGRFAPSTTGPAHPGTLLAALLCWLDARSRGAELVLRLENLDPQRCKPAFADAMVDDLAWLGLDFDQSELQSDNAAAHAAALDGLAAGGHLYPCRCSRSDIRAASQGALDTPDAPARYPGTCRERRLPSADAGGWRACKEAIRLRLPAERIELVDESGLAIGAGAGALDDPVVRRRDGAVAYHLASVVDDYASGVSRVVRGSDLAGSTPVQVAIQRVLGYPTPAYRHHLLLLEEHGGKLAKFHRAVGAPALRERYDAPALCGVLAFAAGLQPVPDAVTPAQLVRRFSWAEVGTEDRLVHWTGNELVMPA